MPQNTGGSVSAYTNENYTIQRNHFPSPFAMATPAPCLPKDVRVEDHKTTPCKETKVCLCSYPCAHSPNNPCCDQSPQPTHKTEDEEENPSVECNACGDFSRRTQECRLCLCAACQDCGVECHECGDVVCGIDCTSPCSTCPNLLCLPCHHGNSRCVSCRTRTRKAINPRRLKKRKTQ